MFKKSREIERICKNCLLFDSKNNRCKVVVLHNGDRYNIPVDPEEECFFEDKFEAVNLEGKKETFSPEINQVKWWCEDPNTGEKANKGIVKIEYPDGFFGKEEEKPRE
jgi:hypothetical protein